MNIGWEHGVGEEEYKQEFNPQPRPKVRSSTREWAAEPN